MNNTGLFSGVNAAGIVGLWVTDGTPAGTVELAAITGEHATGIAPTNITPFGTKALFNGHSANGEYNLWITDGTDAGTVEVFPNNNPAIGGSGGVDPSHITVVGDKAYFNGGNVGPYTLYVTDGTSSANTRAVNASVSYDPIEITGLGHKVLFNGTPTIGSVPSLWATDGVSGINQLAIGIDPADITVFGNKALFRAVDAGGDLGLWVTDGSVPGTDEITPKLLGSVDGVSLHPSELTVLNSTKVLFNGRDAKGGFGLFVTNGTLSGTKLLTANINPDEISVLNPTKALFAGTDAAGIVGLWSTNGTTAGTKVVLAGTAGVGGLQPHEITVLSSTKAVFAGTDASNRIGLWVTDGTAAGTVELVAGATAFGGLNPTDITLLGSQALFAGTDPATGVRGLWITDGTVAGTTQLLSGAAWGGLNPQGIADPAGHAIYVGGGAGNIVQPGTDGFDTVIVWGDGDLTLVAFDAAALSIEGWQGNDRGVVGDGGDNLLDFGALTSVSGIAFIAGGAGDDVIIGTQFDDHLRGGMGGDTLRGGDGNDVLALMGDTARYDSLDGGAGTDEITVSGTGALTLSAFDAAASSIEVWRGNNQWVYGDGGANRLDFSALAAASGIAMIHARAGDDTIVGTRFADRMRGGGGDDTLVGGEGVDSLRGGLGNDTMTGGPGEADSFLFDTALDAVANVDRILDFEPGLDKIKLDDAVFARLGGPGALAAGFFHVGSGAADGNDHIVYDSASGALYYDGDGAGGSKQVQFASLAPGLALTSADFQVV